MIERIWVVIFHDLLFLLFMITIRKSLFIWITLVLVSAYNFFQISAYFLLLLFIISEKISSNSFNLLNLLSFIFFMWKGSNLKIFRLLLLLLNWLLFEIQTSLICFIKLIFIVIMMRMIHSMILILISSIWRCIIIKIMSWFHFLNIFSTFWWSITVIPFFVWNDWFQLLFVWGIFSRLP